MPKIKLVKGHVLYYNNQRYDVGKEVEISDREYDYLTATYPGKFAQVEQKQEENKEEERAQPNVEITKDDFEGLENNTHDEIDSLAMQLGLMEFSKSNLTKAEKVEELKDHFVYEYSKK